MNILTLLAGWKGYAITAAAASMIAASVAWAWQTKVYRAEIAALRAAHAEDEAGRANAHALEMQDARAEDKRRIETQAKEINDAIKKSEAARADARAADAVSRELRARLATITNASRNPFDPATVSSSPPAGDTIGVLADLLSRADQRAGVLAAYADAARIAGQACERSYDALIPPSTD